MELFLWAKWLWYIAETDSCPLSVLMTPAIQSWLYTLPLYSVLTTTVYNPRWQGAPQREWSTSHPSSHLPQKETVWSHQPPSQEWWLYSALTLIKQLIKSVSHGKKNSITISYCSHESWHKPYTQLLSQVAKLMEPLYTWLAALL